MTRKLICQALVRLYPAKVRDVRAGELIGTLLDAGDPSLAAFIANATSVAWSGLAARARDELSRSSAQIVLGALCWAAVLQAMIEVVEGTGVGLYWGGTIFSWGGDPETVIDMYVLPTLILGLSTAGRWRTVGVLGLVRVALRVHQSPLMPLDDFIMSFSIQVAGFGLLVAAPGRARLTGRYLWAIPATGWAFYWLTLLGQHSGVGKLTAVVASLVALPIAPALVLGVGIDWLMMGANYLANPGEALSVHVVELLACLPVVGLLTVVSCWVARRPVFA